MKVRIKSRCCAIGWTAPYVIHIHGSKQHSHCGGSRHQADGRGFEPTLSQHPLSSSEQSDSIEYSYDYIYAAANTWWDNAWNLSGSLMLTLVLFQNDCWLTSADCILLFSFIFRFLHIIIGAYPKTYLLFLPFQNVGRTTHTHCTILIALSPRVGGEKSMFRGRARTKLYTKDHWNWQWRKSWRYLNEKSVDPRMNPLYPLIMTMKISQCKFLFRSYSQQNGRGLDLEVTSSRCWLYWLVSGTSDFIETLFLYGFESH